VLLEGQAGAGSLGLAVLDERWRLQLDMSAAANFTARLAMGGSAVFSQAARFMGDGPYKVERPPLPTWGNDLAAHEPAIHRVDP
jgi:hypothetical protein